MTGANEELGIRPEAMGWEPKSSEQRGEVELRTGRMAWKASLEHWYIDKEGCYRHLCYDLR